MKWKDGRRDGNIEDRRKPRGPRNSQNLHYKLSPGNLIGGDPNRPYMRGEEELRRRNTGR